MTADEESYEKEDYSSSSSHHLTNHHIENKERLQIIVDNMSDDELKRYESFRRAGFNKSAIRKLTNAILKQSCNNNFIICVSGVAKVFVGEMIEMAKRVQAEWQDEGGLMPRHVHEAYRRLYETMPHLKARNKNKWF